MLYFRFSLLAVFVLVSTAVWAINDRVNAEFFLDGQVVDHYKVLGVARNASPEELRSAFRLKAAATHPDQNPGVATIEFQRVNFSYQILKDPKKRAQYDRLLLKDIASPPRSRRPSPEQRSGASGKSTANSGAPNEGQTYKKWDPRDYSPGEEKWYADPPPRAKPRPEPSRSNADHGRAASAYRRTSENMASALDQVPRILRTHDGGFWNYFAIAGVRGTDSTEEIQRVIALREIALQKELERTRGTKEAAAWMRREGLLRKAKEVLLNPELKKLYFTAAQKITTKDRVSGRKRLYADVLRDYVPAHPAPPPLGSKAACSTWFGRLFR